MTRGLRLIGDLGGTHARFALAGADGYGLERELSLETSGYATAEEAIEDYLLRVGAEQPFAVCLAVAAPVVSDAVHFPNSHWSLDRRRLADRFPGAPILLVNDFTAAAHAIPQLTSQDLVPVGGNGALPDDCDFTVALLGPGTGLGMGGLIREGGRFHSLSSEGGHSGFAPETPRQMQVLEHLRQRLGRVSAERLLSGPGIRNIYRVLQELEGLSADDRNAAGIFELAAGGEALAVETESLFFEILGQAAGDLALTIGAFDGVYIGGGIARRYPERLLASPFRSGFENKGRYRGLMEQVPVFLITHPSPGLLGASYLARNLKSA